MAEYSIQLSDQRTRNKILIIDITGTIKSGSRKGFNLLSITTPDQVKSILDKASQDKWIKAIILKIDSPGGEVTATDLIYHEIIQFKERTGIPIYASLMGVACSGAYYIACTADKIYSHPTTLTGSIGIIARFPKMIELADKIGYQEEIISTGKMKSMGHPLREMSPEVRAVLQHHIDSLYNRFLNIIITHRPKYNTIHEIKPHADGRTFDAQKSVSLGLTDGIGYMSEVIVRTQKAASLNRANIVKYMTGYNSDLNIYSNSHSLDLSVINLVNFDIGSFTRKNTGFFYLWEPGQH